MAEHGGIWRARTSTFEALGRRWPQLFGIPEGLNPRWLFARARGTGVQTRQAWPFVRVCPCSSLFVALCRTNIGADRSASISRNGLEWFSNDSRKKGRRAGPAWRFFPCSFLVYQWRGALLAGHDRALLSACSSGLKVSPGPCSLCSDGMNYQDWLNAVDLALKASGKGYGTGLIDPAHLQNAFSQGQSPVLYARLPAHPLTPPPMPVPPAPIPDTLPPLTFSRASYIVRFLDGFGWVFQILGWGAVALWGIALLVGGAGTAVTHGVDKGIGGALAGALFTLAVPFSGLFVVFFGIVCWWLSGVFRAVYRSR